MIKSKRNIMIAAVIVAAIFVCALSMAMLSCSGNAIAADEQLEAEEAFSEDALDVGVSDEFVDVEQTNAAIEGEASADMANEGENLAIYAPEGSPNAGTNAPSKASSASAPVITSKSASASTQGAQPQSNAHVHDWVAMTEPRTVIDRAAWSEPRYETVEKTICTVCGEDLTHGDKQGRSPLQHGKAHALQGQGGGYESVFVQEQVGVIEHPAETHTEYVVTGYRCSSCGATKG